MARFQLAPGALAPQAGIQNGVMTKDTGICIAPVRDAWPHASFGRVTRKG
jgi:hypothetical protein